MFQSINDLINIKINKKKKKVQIIFKDIFPVNAFFRGVYGYISRELFDGTSVDNIIGQTVTRRSETERLMSRSNNN